MPELWEALPLWEQLVTEISLGGYALLDWVRAQAVDKLVLDTLLQPIVDRPELSEIPAKLLRVPPHRPAPQHDQ